MRSNKPIPDNDALAQMFKDYYNDRMHLYPIEGTQNGYSGVNDQMKIDFTDRFLDSIRLFFGSYLTKINSFDRSTLNKNDQISYDIFKREMKISLEGIDLHFAVNNYTMPNLQYMPFNQFEGLPIFLGQMGSGTGVQPFKTVQDYKNWIQRASVFPDWADSAIVYFRKGLLNGYILPRCLVEKMIPEMKDMAMDDVTKSIFYGPVKNFPAAFDSSDKAILTGEMAQLISQKLTPAYKRLADFLEKEYLPKSRPTVGFYALPNGDKLYDYLIRYWTTTNKSPGDLYQKGLSEVKRIRTEMEKVKSQIGFSGDLQSFFQHMKEDPKLMPFKAPEEVLNAFRDIQKTIDPNLNKIFGRKPKTQFEIRQTEAFRAASASAEYVPGAPDGSRPGIFYVPIVDATKYNVTSMESLFLHEAIPGHHYQISLQMEDTLLPDFRRFSWYGAYGEGWALYSESLGKELGLYTDPYKYMGALGDEMHRAIRLVVDVAIHVKKMTREEAIRYMMENQSISEQSATAEIERYIAIPAQALSYKTGGLLIRELRDRYETELGPHFKISDFHDEVLRDGCMPLDVFENKMNAWEMNQ